VCITTNQRDAKSNPNYNPNPTTEQQAVVSIQLNIVTCPTCPEKFIRGDIVAPFSLLSVCQSAFLNMNPCRRRLRISTNIRASYRELCPSFYAHERMHNSKFRRPPPVNQRPHDHTAPERVDNRLLFSHSGAAAQSLRVWPPADRVFMERRRGKPY